MSSTVISARGNREQAEQVDFRSLLWVGPLAVVAAAVANIIVREIAVALGAVPADYELLKWPGVVGSTVLQAGLGVVVFAIIARFARRPIRLFRVVAAVALVLSFAFPLLAGSGAMQVPGATTPNGSTVATMLVMHIVAALVSVGLVTTLARKK